jgi:hypothetical protein
MSKHACDICGQGCDIVELERHNIVPREIRELVEGSRFRVVTLCPACSAELRRWNVVRVSDKRYDSKTKRFVVKSPEEIAREYPLAYKLFRSYKQSQTS